MVSAEELLDSLDESNPALYAEITTAEDPHIIIGKDRFITVPESLKRLGVQHDHNIETVTFDCPRYCDDVDLSQMMVYINYGRRDGSKGRYLVKSVIIDETDDAVIHFDWTIDGHVTEYDGQVKFIVCAEKLDADGLVEKHWSSEISSECYISEGLEVDETTDYTYSDVTSQLLSRVSDLELTLSTWEQDHKDDAKDYIILKDSSTGTNYKLAIVDGKLTATEKV